mmetsp:Transcript_2020/g.3794  ORF Transcript_2020/g.3794 Transcript_2020/m.3794 type:complete len:241 (-) Transcript_2020:1052-1774(-)
MMQQNGAAPHGGRTTAAGRQDDNSRWRQEWPMAAILQSELQKGAYQQRGASEELHGCAQHEGWQGNARSVVERATELAVAGRRSYGSSGGRLAPRSCLGRSGTTRRGPRTPAHTLRTRPSSPGPPSPAVSSSSSPEAPPPVISLPEPSAEGAPSLPLAWLGRWAANRGVQAPSVKLQLRLKMPMKVDLRAQLGGGGGRLCICSGACGDAVPSSTSREFLGRRRQGRCGRRRRAPRRGRRQ